MAKKSKNMDKLKHEDAPIRVYKANPFLYVLIVMISFFWLMIASVPFLMALVTLQSSHMLAAIVFFLVISGMGFVVFYPFTNVMKEKISVYEDGLEYSSPEKTLFSRWDDLASFGLEPPQYSRATIWGIYANAISKQKEGESFSVKGDFFFPLNVLSVPTRWSGGYLRGSFVLDTESFARTDFGRELLHYAPHLFAEAKEKAKNS
jgi:hypothetical protein